MYLKARSRWAPTPTKFPKACDSSCLYAISAKPPGEVRLYYQGTDNKIKERFKDSNNRWHGSEY
jgi:hypothetical protein